MLTTNELQHISRLLMDGDATNVELGLQLLAPYATQAGELQKELAIIGIRWKNNSDMRLQIRQLKKAATPQPDWILLQGDVSLFQAIGLRFGKKVERLLRMMKNYEQVKEQYEPLILQNQFGANEYIRVAQQLHSEIGAEAIPYAESMFKAVIDKYPDWKDAWEELLDFYVGCKDKKKQKECLLTMTARVILDDAALWQRLSEFWEQEKNWEKAIECYQKIIEYTQPYQNTYCWNIEIAWAYQHLEDDENAEKHLAEASRLVPIGSGDEDDCCDAWARYYRYRKKDFAQAEKYYLQGLEINPNSDLIWVNYAELLGFVVNRPDEAVIFYEKVLASKGQFFHYGSICYVCLLVHIIKNKLRAMQVYESLLNYLRSRHIRDVHHEHLDEEQWQSFLEALKELDEKLA